MKQLFGILKLGSIQSRHGFEGYFCTIMPTAETKWHPRHADLVVFNLNQ